MSINTTGEITVFLADAHEVVRAAYRRLLNFTPGIRVVGEAADGESAVQGYFEHRPDVLVIDRSIPGIDGIAASNRILSNDKKARILILSVIENRLFMTQSLDLGVLGYLSKRNTPQMLVDAVRHVAEGVSYVGQEIKQRTLKAKRPQLTDLFL